MTEGDPLLPAIFTTKDNLHICMFYKQLQLQFVNLERIKQKNRACARHGA
jgi:hypothetical protein